MTPPSARFLRLNAPWLAAGMLLTFSSSYGQTYFIAVFSGDIRSAFGLGHGAWGSIYAAGTLISAMLMVWAGGLTDLYRARSIGAATLVLLAAACLAMAVVPSALALIPVIVLLRFAGQGMMAHVAITGMSRWFVAARGKALSIATLGFALGEGLLPIVFAAVLAGGLHWRHAWGIAAALALAAIPLLLWLLRSERTPRGDAGTMQVPGLSNRHWRRGEMLRHPLFWWLLPALTAPPAFVTALFFQQVHLAESKGWAHVQLVALFPAYTATSIAAMLATGWIIDRVGAARLMPFYLLPMAAGFGVMSQTGILPGALLALMLVAMSQATFNTVNAAAFAEIYGTRHIGSIRSLAAALMVLATAVGPVLTGTLIDAGLPFARQMPGIAAWMLLASVLSYAGTAPARIGRPARQPT